MTQDESPKSRGARLMGWFQGTILSKTREFSFVPAENLPAHQGDRPGVLEDQTIYRFERGQWVPLEGVHAVSNPFDKPMAAGRRVYVMRTDKGNIVAISQEDRESN